MRNTLTILVLVLWWALPVWAAGAGGLQELRIRWDAYPGSPTTHVAPGAAVPSTDFTLLERRQVAGSLPRQRSAELSSQQLVVVALDNQGKELYRRVIPDPRVLRMERPGPEGELKGKVLHAATTEFLVALPADPAIKELWLYHPSWTGTAFVLEWLGKVLLD